MRLLRAAGGLRVGGRSAGRNVAPFARVLFGAFRLSGEGTATGGYDGETITVTTDSESVTKPMLQAGGGLDIWITNRLAIRASADYLRVFGEVLGEDVGLNGIRAGVGAVVGF
jgi:hypothetical protein